MDYESLRNDILKDLTRIEKIRDKHEKQKQYNEVNEKIRKLNELFCLEREQNKQAVSDDMQKRGVVAHTYDLDAGTLKIRWEGIFTNALSQDEKKQIYLQQFLWHIFSYEKVPHLKNDMAREAFNKIPKSTVIGFYQHNETVFLYENAALLRDTDFDLEDDFYLVDPDFHWTYTVTHEKGLCGPYFSEPPKAAPPE